ncbi:hypothetical protein C3L33_16500, partial [Rhododendron williamsianum]
MLIGNGGALYVAGAALCGAASSLYMLIPGWFLLGIGIGFVNQVISYLSEMALPRYRGAISNGFQFSLNMGALSSNLINYGTFGQERFDPVALVIRIVSASSTFISMLVVDKLGRRVLFSVGGVQMLASQVIVGCIMKNQLGDYGGVSKGYGFVLTVLICIYVSGELFVHHCHCSDLFVDVMPFQGRDFLVLRVVSGGDDRFVYLFLPETKNVPIEQVDRVGKEHWF